jgi:hypothetical protein
MEVSLYEPLLFEEGITIWRGTSLFSSYAWMQRTY